MEGLQGITKSPTREPKSAPKSQQNTPSQAASCNPKSPITPKNQALATKSPFLTADRFSMLQALGLKIFEILQIRLL
jgi:hypothetical protein